eukprot:TRINITY_DN2915_c0_g3_i3.p1 TRINITY_DN2915_c0_g3~~TRINITY_DN2915_c0_g3_i3.p1  ORF type:complete len:400 (+),score=103.19 TRINITY_DN2915_c0_g3_i3:10-1209(+)
MHDQPHRESVATCKCRTYVCTLQDHRYARKGVKPVVEDPQGDKAKKVWLISDAAGTAEAVREVAGERVEVDVPLTHTNYTAYEILCDLLPVGMTVPSSFEGVGHIAHINLKDEQHKYRFLIGKVILDKNPAIKTVVNKLGTIGSEFREFQFELLAGVPEYKATVRQHSCTFTFNYDKVYWNSRLQTEHTRLVEIIGKDDILADVMAGVGPFAVPAAKKGIRVFSNDLNPESYAAMVQNAAANGVAKRCTCSNLDGRVFVRNMRDLLLTEATEEGRAFLQGNGDVHFSMNLPATAVEFLDAFRDWGPEAASSRAVIHVYCFSSAVDFKADALRMAQEHLGSTLAAQIAEPSVHHVRNVAPKKEMCCVSFRLASLDASRKRKRADGDDHPDSSDSKHSRTT